MSLVLVCPQTAEPNLHNKEKKNKKTKKENKRFQNRIFPGFAAKGDLGTERTLSPRFDFFHFSRLFHRAFCLFQGRIPIREKLGHTPIRRVASETRELSTSLSVSLSFHSARTEQTLHPLLHLFPFLLFPPSQP